MLRARNPIKTEVFLSSFITFVVLMFMHHVYYDHQFSKQPRVFINHNELQTSRLIEKEEGRVEFRPGTREGPGDKPVVWLANALGTIGQEVTDGRFIHKAAVLNELGFYLGDGNDDWDLLISFVNYHKHIQTRLQPYQRVSVMPGHDAVTKKKELMKKGYQFMPKSFQIPEQRAEFLDYMAECPDAIFLEKREAHRGAGVLLANIQEIRGSNRSRSLQQFISDPLLVDGRKMEMSVYLALTSVNPLRVYINDGDWYFRLCSEPYEPFDIHNRNKYVLQSDTNLKTWDMPSLDAFDKYSLTHKEAVFNFLRSSGYKTEKLEKEVRAIVTKVYADGETDMVKRGQAIWDKFGSSRNFFDVVRCDFVLDRKLKPYLVEITDYPGSSTMKPRNKEQFRQVWYSAFHLLGFASNKKRKQMNKSWLERDMLITERDLTTFTDFCIRQNCTQRCSHNMCSLCGPCLNTKDKTILSDSYMEHVNKFDWNRVIPRPFESQDEAKRWHPLTDPDYAAVRPKTRWLTRWYWGKCLMNHAWCL